MSKYVEESKQHEEVQNNIHHKLYIQQFENGNCVKFVLQRFAVFAHNFPFNNLAMENCMKFICLHFVHTDVISLKTCMKHI